MKRKKGYVQKHKKQTKNRKQNKKSLKDKKYKGKMREKIL